MSLKTNYFNSKHVDELVASSSQTDKALPMELQSKAGRACNKYVEELWWLHFPNV